MAISSSGGFYDPYEADQGEFDPSPTYTKVALSVAIKKFGFKFQGRLVCLIDTYMSQRAFVDNPHHMIAACGANEKGNSEITGFGRNVERILKEALVNKKYVTVGGVYDQLNAAVLTGQMRNVPVHQSPYPRANIIRSPTRA